jgi:hypothetical protein
MVTDVLITAASPSGLFGVTQQTACYSHPFLRNRQKRTEQVTAMMPSTIG